MSARIKFLNLWSGLLDRKHPAWKNHKVQFSINQTLNDEIEKKKTKWKIQNKKKNTIKRMRFNIEIKIKLEDN